VSNLHPAGRPARSAGGRSFSIAAGTGGTEGDASGRDSGATAVGAAVAPDSGVQQFQSQCSPVGDDVPVLDDLPVDRPEGLVGNANRTMFGAVR
jgi:hypothetical protein